MIINSTQASFSDDVVKSDISIIDFWAPWCGPCKVIAPILESFDENSTDDINIIKVNVDEHPELAGTYNIRNIPTLLFVRNGEILSQHVGTLSEADLTQKVNNLK